MAVTSACAVLCSESRDRRRKARVLFVVGQDYVSRCMFECGDEAGGAEQYIEGGPMTPGGNTSKALKGGIATPGEDPNIGGTVSPGQDLNRGGPASPAEDPSTCVAVPRSKKQLLVHLRELAPTCNPTDICSLLTCPGIGGPRA